MLRNSLWILVILFCQGLFAQDFDSAKLNTYFDVLEANNKLMGSVAVSKGGEILYTKSIGYSDIERLRKNNHGTRYTIGSVSKTFTAVLVMKAVELEKLNLNQTIEAFFPTVPNADKITIANLLYHRSGLFNFTNNPGYLNWISEPKSEAEMIAMISQTKPDFEPDAKTEYSNTNYVLLSYILEKVMDASYGELLDEYIVEPLELRDTYFSLEPVENNFNSVSYNYIGDWKLQPDTPSSIPMGAGGIVSTAVSLTKFIDGLFRGDLLSEESLKQMQTIKGDLGMGLFPMPFDNKQGIGHTGGIDGYKSVLVHFPDVEVSYALVSNASNYDINNVSIAVLSAVFGLPYNHPEFNDFVPDTSDLEAYIGVYASEQLPMKMTLTTEGTTLVAQATGQSAFPLEAVERDVFKFDNAGVVIEFDRANNSLVLKQMGAEFLFKKE